MKFTKLTAISRHRKGVPRDAWYAARLVAALAEDCGPCTQLVATMAERAGVDAALLTAILARDELAMTEDVRLAARFARAVIAHDDAADPLRAEVVARWGAKGLVSLGLAITASRLYPTLKYALGHGRTCHRIVVAGAPVAVAKDRVIDATNTSHLEGGFF